MRLILNEQEIVDGICVYISNEEDIYPEDVEVKAFFLIKLQFNDGNVRIEVVVFL